MENVQSHPDNWGFPRFTSHASFNDLNEDPADHSKFQSPFTIETTDNGGSGKNVTEQGERSACLQMLSASKAWSHSHLRQHRLGWCLKWLYYYSAMKMPIDQASSGCCTVQCIFGESQMEP